MKKFTTIVMTCLIMLVVVLTGCSAFKVDKVKYYNEILARVGEENITRFDLVNAYNNYGYTNYVVQRGLSEKEALLNTMDLLVERKLMVQYAKDNPTKFSLSEYEIKKLYRSTLDYLLESFENNVEQARKIYNLEQTDEDDNNNNSDSNSKISEYFYESRVTLVKDSNQQYQIAFKDTDTEKEDIVLDKSLDDCVKYFKNYYQDSIVKTLKSQFKKELKAQLEEEFERRGYSDYEAVATKVYNKAIELACNNLVNYEYYLREDGKKLTTNQEDLLFRFVERSYISELESAYITKVNTVYLKTEKLSNDSVLEAYKALYKSDYARYENDQNLYNENIIKTDGDLIYYHVNDDAQFGYFLHVLLPFNNVEEDLTWLKDHRHLYTDEEYEAEQMALINQITCVQRSVYEVRDEDSGEIVYEEGETMEGEISFLDVLEEYESEVYDLNTFVEFMFKYSTDTATLTADMPYVIGYNTVTDEAYSSMVTNFTNEAIRLMKSNQKYTQTNEYILTNYGVHLLYYVSPLTNQIAIEDINKITVSSLKNAVLNPVTGETYLDRVFDLVYPEGSDGMFSTNTQYSSYEQKLVDSLYAKYPVTLYQTKINASNKV